MSKFDHGTQFGLLGFINPAILLRLIKRLPTVAPRRFGRLSGVLGAGLAMLPLVAAEKVLKARELQPQELEQPPVFIIGHWRSGTTHLHNLLSQDSQFGCVRMFETVAPLCSLISRGWLPQIMSRVMSTKRPMDNLSWPMDAPQEEEIALAKLTPYSWYLQFMFPQNAIPTFESHVLLKDAKTQAKEEVKRQLRHIFQVALLHESSRSENENENENEGRPALRLLSKNPVNTARIPLLLEMYPDARFVYLHRSPLEVFASSKKLHRTILELTSMQDYSEADIERNVLEIYPSVIEQYLKDRELLPHNRLVEIGFAELEANPMKTVQAIYERLELTGFEAAQPKIQSYVDSQSNYEKNKFAELAPHEEALVRTRWAKGFAAGGYSNETMPAAVSNANEAKPRPIDLDKNPINQTSQSVA